ncbi:methyltransferase domain-containing protein [Parvularcula sp. ZS-1/3]|uniref:Arsenite methyltransferase n=1 Tax=Parvularcula mediterranea TaxID=2732508 RepID=A0A7Y3W3S1_9PROT|nr:methyltransferase domain-containing protein [Parvularcula mediterranea]NNU14753.1 methyltransferase domain-containing protein [Parvularcula mediterranea]
MNIENSQLYYGKVLQGSEDLRTDACCTTEAPPLEIRQALSNVHDEVTGRYYGCGLVAPECLEGAAILDLGSGSGQDAYVLSQLVGPKGRIVGVDATPEQLEVANRHKDWHAERFGFANVEFMEGDIEKLDELDLEPGSFDIIVSNCVINLVQDKRAVFEQAHRLLKEGGEIYFSDVYGDRRVPEELQRDPVLHGECISGALYWGDFDRITRECGFADPRLVHDRPLVIGDPQQLAKVQGYNFFSATYRLFKLAGLEPRCEDYGQAVIYRGTIPGMEDAFALDNHHLIQKGRVFPVCGNTFLMLKDTRFAEHFEFIGDFSTHYGIFKGCGIEMPYGSAVKPDAEATSGACC